MARPTTDSSRGDVSPERDGGAAAYSAADPALLWRAGAVFQVLMRVLFGMLGVSLATPLAAVALVVLLRLYVREVLGDVTEDLRRA